MLCSGTSRSPGSQATLGGTPQHWARYGRAYREARARAGHPDGQADIAVAVHGFVAESGDQARAGYLEHEHRMMADGPAEPGRPDESADRILSLHALLGHTRQILQVDVGGLPHRDFPHAIEPLGTAVLPRLRAELGTP